MLAALSVSFRMARFQAACQQAQDQAVLFMTDRLAAAVSNVGRLPANPDTGLEPTSRTEICRKSPSGKTGMPVPRRHRTEPCRLWLAAFIQVGTPSSPYFPEQGLFGYGRHMWKANLGQASGSSSARSTLSCTRSETTEMRSLNSVTHSCEADVFLHKNQVGTCLRRVLWLNAKLLC